jgi:hypothetical protein
MFKKILGIGLAAVMAFSASAMAVSAAEINQSGGSGTSRVELSVNASPLKVTVPSVLPIWVDSDNNMTVATDAKITNLSAAPVEVTDLSVTGDNGWSVVPFDTDFTKVPVDTKQYGMTMYNDDVVDGVNVGLFGRLDGGAFKDVVYDGNVAIQSSDINKFDIGHVVFTVAYAQAYGFENEMPSTKPGKTNMSVKEASELLAKAVSIDAGKETALLGDVNLDGDVDAVDATIISRFINKVTFPSLPEKYAPVGQLLMTVADVDGDGAITQEDSNQIMLYGAMSPTQYPVAQPVEFTISQ